MKYLLKSLFCLVVLTSGLATQAQAQLVTYHFTGTKIQGTDGIGNTITGSITLDVGATPYYTGDETPVYGCGEFAFWRNGGFSIDGITNTGITAGTSFGGDTYLSVSDTPCYLFDGKGIYCLSDEGVRSRYIEVGSYNYAATGDGIANVPNPWRPLADQYQGVYIEDFNNSTGVGEWGEFTLDTFTGPPTIIIAGCDTGIQDFVYNGKLVSQHLDDCAAGAKNHGDYVSCVAKLTNALKKAGLLTAAQKNVMMSSAAKSNIGK